MKWLQGALLMVVLTTNIQAQDVYYLRGTGNPPWGSYTNDAELDTVFGQGNWTLEFYQTVNVPALLQFPQTQYIYMEGGALHDTDLSNFLDSNNTEIENWVAAGGRLFINAAGWVEDSINCGFDSTIIHLVQYATASPTAYAYKNDDIIFTCPYPPVDTFWTGKFFSHNIVLGNNLDTLIVNNFTDSLILCARKNWGQGEVMFGGMTTTNWHNPSPHVENLRQNMHAYMYSNITNYFCSGIAGTPITCHDSCNGTSTVSTAGGVPPYSYLWNDPSAQTSATATGLCAGTYIVTVTDDSLNTSVDSWTIAPAPSPMSFDFTTTPPFANCTGTANTNITGGTPNYYYQWDSNANNQTTQTAYNLCAGNYCVTVTDAYGCSTDSCVDIVAEIGISEQTDNNLLKIYPNPTTGIFTVQGTEGEIQVYDLFGRLVLTATKPQVDMSAFPSGLYFVKVGDAVRKLVLR